LDAATVRYVVGDVRAAVDFYTRHLGFILETDGGLAPAAVVRGPLRLLLSGPTSSGWNRVQIVVDDLDREVKRLQAACVPFWTKIVSDTAGRHILLEDPSGNPVELFTPPGSRSRYGPSVE